MDTIQVADSLGSNQWITHIVSIIFLLVVIAIWWYFIRSLIKEKKNKQVRSHV